MKKTFLFLALLPISISAQSVYGVFYNNSTNTSNIYKTDLNCDTTILHSETVSNIFDYQVINENELLIVKTMDGSSYPGIYYKNTLTNELSLKHGVINISGYEYYPTGVFRTKNNSYLAFYNFQNSGSTRIYSLSNDFNSLDYLVNGSFLTKTENIIEPTTNRIFFYFPNSTESFTEMNLLSNSIYIRGISGDQILTGKQYKLQDLTFTNDNRIIYFLKTNSVNIPLSRGYIYSYDLSTNVNTKIDSVDVGSVKFEQFGGTSMCGLNYIGNNEVIVTTNNGGLNGIGQISKYNLITKSITTIHSYTATNEQLNDPVNHGLKFIDLQRNSDINSISYNQCITNPYFFSKLKCPECTYNGVLLSLAELDKNNNYSIYPNPTNSILTILFQETTEIPSSIFLTDLSGKIILEQKTNATSENVIDVSNFAPGTYLLRAGSSTQRVVIE